MGGFCIEYPSIRDGFQIYDYTIGIFFIAYGVYYTFDIYKDICQMPTAAKWAQIVFLIALYGKGLGLFFTAVTISANWTFDSVSLFTNGLPGYLIAAAYCFIFFSWCSVCVKSFSDANATFFNNSKIVLATLLGLIVFFFVLSCILMFSMTEHVIQFHRAEAIIASIRDCGIALAFIFYLFHITKLFGSSGCSFSSPESKLFLMCIVLMIALFYRAISIQIYTWHYSNQTAPDGGCECSSGYLANFAIDQIVTEAVPLLFIGLQKFCCSPSEKSKEDTLDTTLTE